MAAIIVIVGNTGKNFHDHYTSRPAQVYRTPSPTRLTAADRKRIHDVTLRFIGSAVARQHLEDSYDIVGPDIKQGLSRTAWQTGNIPVIPYNVSSVIHFKLDYSFADDVAYEVVLTGKHGTLPAGKTFLIELRRFPRIHHGSWVVEAWVPQGISTDTPAAAVRARTPPPTPSPRLSTNWLLVPAGILGLLFLIPIGLFSRSWYVARRSRRTLLRESAAQISRANPS